MSASIQRADAGSEYWFEEGCFITEWSNSAADPALSVARARVPPRGATRRHRLEGIVERYVVLSGRGRIELGEKDAAAGTAQAWQVTEIGPGDVAIIGPGVTQCITNLGDSDLVFLALCTPRFVPAAYRDVESREPPPDG